MDRETWTHAIVSAAVVLEMDRDVCRSAAHRPGRRRADSVATAGSREAARRAADHRRACRQGRRRGRRRRAPAVAECLQGAADAQSRATYDCGAGRAGLTRMNRRDLLLLRTTPKARVVELSCHRLYLQYLDLRRSISGRRPSSRTTGSVSRSPIAQGRCAGALR